VRTPILTGDTTRVGGRIWRKQVLPLGRVRYEGRDLQFTRDYMQQVIAGFRGRSHDTVPVMLADKTNSHNMAFTDGGGEVLDLDMQDDGLWATVRLSDAAAQQVDFNRKAGVSVRIKHNYEAGDGRTWPAALQHLLLTWDPKANGLKPWQSIALSDTDADVVLDLSDLEYETEGGPIVPEENTTAPQLSAEEVTALRALLARADQTTGGDGGTEQTEQQPPPQQTPPAQTPAAGTQNGDVDRDDLSDDELDRIIAAALGEPATRDGANAAAEPAPAAAAQLSNPAEHDQLALANAQIAELQTSQAALTRQLDAAAYERERDQLVRDTLLPPDVIELARPLLEGSTHEVALSNGTQVDAGAVMRRVLTRIGEVIKVLDLSDRFAARADADAADEEHEAAERRREMARAFLVQGGLIHQPAGS
jgi:hypothetical protein